MVSKITSQNHAIRKTKGKKSVKSQEDRLSKLPDDILSSIVSYFTVRDAASASLVSRKWRHLSASMSKLNFDWDTMFKTHDGWNHETHCCEEYRDRFVRGVNEFVRYHNGLRLFLFRTSFCLDGGCTSAIDQWVSFALSRAVEWLHLGLTCPKSGEIFENKNYYVLRSELLSHRNAAKVYRLELSACIINPGVIERFSFLKHLTLGHMPLGQESVESIICHCLNLEWMILINCSVVCKLCISGSLPRLTFLAVLHCLDLKEIELSTSNLATFEYGGKMIRFSFSQAHNLEKVYFRIDDQIGMQSAFRELGKDLSLVKAVSFVSLTNWVQSLPRDLTKFSNAKRLELSFSGIELDLGGIILVLRACPVLENLNLVVMDCILHFEQGVRGGTELVAKHLKEICIGGFDYWRTLIEFIIHLLEHATVLEKLILEEEKTFYIGARRWKIYDANKKWSEGKRQNVCEQLQEHSKNAAIIIR